MSDRDESESGEGGGGRPGLPIDLLRIWNALRSGWQIIAVATVVGAFLGAAIAKKVVKQSFGAHAVIAWESANNTSSPMDTVQRQTVLESVTLPSNLEAVRKKMGLSMPARDVANFITVGSNPNSNIISIDAMWATPEGAAAMANGLVQVFMESRAKLVKDRLQAELNRYKEAVSEAERKQKAAAEAYEKFRRENGILDISAERELAIKQAASLSAEADSARATASAAKSELDRMNAAPANDAPPVNVMSEADRAQGEADLKRLPQARNELNVARVQFSDEHPNVRRILAEIDALEKRIQARGDIRNMSATGGKRLENIQKQAASAAARQKAAEQYAAQLQERLNKLSAVEGQAAVLLGEISVSEKTLEAAKSALNVAELAASQPPQEFRVLEQAKPQEIALSSPRKRVAVGFPIGFFAVSLIGVIVWRLRKLDVVTPKEAAFWADVPVIGASTWPRDPDMLSSLMHDLDDFAPQCEGVTLIVGVSLDEAHLARRVAEWDGHRMPKAYDAQKLLAAGSMPDKNALAMLREDPNGRGDDTTSMQILTLTGPVPAQALRRAARLADRVLVVVTSGKHSYAQMTRIKNRLGRENGIGILLVGLPKEYAMVRDRVGEVERFWHATRLPGRAEA